MLNHWPVKVKQSGSHWDFFHLTGLGAVLGLDVHSLSPLQFGNISLSIQMACFHRRCGNLDVWGRSWVAKAEEEGLLLYCLLPFTHQHTSMGLDLAPAFLLGLLNSFLLSPPGDQPPPKDRRGRQSTGWPFVSHLPRDYSGSCAFHKLCSELPGGMSVKLAVPFSLGYP